MTTITPADPPLQSPGEPVSSATLRALWVDNPAGALEETYGTRSPLGAGVVLPHDHAQGGGEVLTGPLCAVVLSSYTAGDGTLDPGVPLLPASASAGIDANGKVLAAAGVYLPGGVESLRLALLVVPEYAGTENVPLAVLVRPLSSVNRNALGPTTTEAEIGGHIQRLSATVDGALAWKILEVDFDDLSRLGSAREGRLAEIVLVQTGGFASGKRLHLCSLTVYALTTAPPRTARPGDRARGEVALLSVSPGSALTEALTSRAAYSQASGAVALLGGEPGREGGALDTRRPWSQDLTAPHEHTGRTLTDDAGRLYSDGALLPRTLWAGSWTADLRDNATPALTDALPGRGLEAHATGNTGSAWPLHRARLSIPQGCRSLKMRLALQPSESGASRAVYLLAHLSALNQSIITDDDPGYLDTLPSLITEIDGSALLDGEIDTPATQGYRVARIYAEAAPGYVPGSEATSAAWSRASRTAAAATSAEVTREHSARVSREISLSLDDHATGDYLLRWRVISYDTAGEKSNECTPGICYWWACIYDPGEV